MKKVFGVTLLILGVGFFAGCGESQVSEELEVPGSEMQEVGSDMDNQQEASSNDPEDGVGVVEKDVDWRVYENEKYDFILSFPETWEGYEVTENYSNGNDMIGFSFSGDGFRPFSILQIYIESKQDWDKKSSTIIEEKKLYILGKNDSIVVFTDGDFENCTQLNEFQCQRKRETEEILKSFKLTE
jgi:hypothetical protein